MIDKNIDTVRKKLRTHKAELIGKAKLLEQQIRQGSKSRSGQPGKPKPE